MSQKLLCAFVFQGMFDSGKLKLLNFFFACLIFLYYQRETKEKKKKKKSYSGKLIKNA